MKVFNFNLNSKHLGGEYDFYKSLWKYVLHVGSGNTWHQHSGYVVNKIIKLL